jgi:hypothetical protein
MATAYVRGPFSNGCISAKVKYCNHNCQGGDPCDGNGNTHGTCGGGATNSAVDVAYVSGSLDVYLRVNYPTVNSIKTFVNTLCCGCDDNYKRTIKVELYQCPNAIGYIGTVIYAHIASPQVNNNTIYNLTSSSKKLGTAPSTACGCYGGVHSHMERLGGSTLSTICCAVSVSSSSNIYSWNFTPFAICPT